jgi:very-short-patch-repair endonuclease
MPFRYNPKLKLLARELRKKSTLAEVLLWRCLRKGQRGGYDFHRQKPIDAYIVDFLAPELMLAIEIDGKSHKLKGQEDDERQKRLEALGIRFLRFDDAMVKTHLNHIVQAIDNWIAVNEPKR